MLFFLLLCGVFGSSIWVMWVFMELMNILFISFLWSDKKTLSYSSFIYYVVQMSAGILMIFGIFLELDVSLYSNLVLVCLFIKLGMFPFHFWVFFAMKGMSWWKIFIMLTVMKGLPLVIMCMYAVNFDVLWLCVAGMLISFACLHEWSTRSILTYSSINHMSWLVACAMFSKGLTFFYFMCYSYLAFLFCFFMDNSNAFILKKIYLLKDMSKWVNTMMLNFSGLPPFVGFYPKIVVMAYMVFYSFYIESFLFLFLSLVPLYYYMKIFSVSMTGEPSYMKSFIIFFNEQRWIFFSNIMIALITLLILYSIS